MSFSEHAVRQGGSFRVRKGFLSLKAKDDIVSGSFITDLWGLVVDSATPYTIQIEVNKHVDPVGALITEAHLPLLPTKLQVCISTAQPEWSNPRSSILPYLVAERDIKKGEDITVDYTTTEYESARPFKCLCGVVGCPGEMKGFKFLPAEEKMRRKNLLSQELFIPAPDYPQ